MHKRQITPTTNNMGKKVMTKQTSKPKTLRTKNGNEILKKNGLVATLLVTKFYLFKSILIDYYIYSFGILRITIFLPLGIPQ
jgi:hypothetical protein